MITMKQLDTFKQNVNSLMGRTIRVKTKMHRGKIKTYEGTISGVYSNYFNVTIDKENINRQLCISFTDVLTKNIYIKLIEE